MSFAGIDLTSNKISVPLILITFIGSGLSYFMALTWSNFMQNIYTDYKKDEELKGTKNNFNYNLKLTMISTLFTILITFILLMIFFHIRNQFQITL